MCRLCSDPEGYHGYSVIDAKYLRLYKINDKQAKALLTIDQRIYIYTINQLDIDKDIDLYLSELKNESEFEYFEQNWQGVNNCYVLLAGHKVQFIEIDMSIIIILEDRIKVLEDKVNIVEQMISKIQKFDSNKSIHI